MRKGTERAVRHGVAGHSTERDQVFGGKATDRQTPRGELGWRGGPSRRPRGVGVCVGVGALSRLGCLWVWTGGLISRLVAFGPVDVLWLDIGAKGPLEPAQARVIHQSQAMDAGTAKTKLWHAERLLLFGVTSRGEKQTRRETDEAKRTYRWEAEEGSRFLGG